MNESTFDWHRVTIGTLDDIERIRKKALSGTLPAPSLAAHDLEERFQPSTLEEDIRNNRRIFVLLERNKDRIEAIVELFRSEKHSGLYYSKTPLQWGRSINTILPDILKTGEIPCREVAIPLCEHDKRVQSRYTKKSLETLDGKIVTMHVADIR